jgi:hypothetical protein
MKMYKDKEKQREANRKAQVKFKAKGITNRPPSGITEQEFIEEAAKVFDVPTGLKRGKDIKCFADLPPDVQRAVAKQKALLSEGAVCSGVVTGKPGDADYNGICTEAWRAERGR